MNGVTLVLFVVVLPGTLDVLIMNGVTLVCRGRTAGFLWTGWHTVKETPSVVSLVFPKSRAIPIPEEQSIICVEPVYRYSSTNHFPTSMFETDEQHGPHARPLRAIGSWVWGKAGTLPPVAIDLHPKFYRWEINIMLPYKVIEFEAIVTTIWRRYYLLLSDAFGTFLCFALNVVLKSMICDNSYLDMSKCS